MPLQLIYIDADIFYYATALDTRKCEVSLGRDNLAHIDDACKENSEIRVVVPQVTLGECVLNGLQGEIDISETLRILHHMEVEFESPTSEIYRKAYTLMNYDYYLTGNDALFISHALCNKDTKHIISTEGIFRTSRPVL
ncbi:hypothetical protein AC482_07410 [miscellaneous Crenarchaeota group-15 archaeon DG-45]|uniref:PIN domain-containing protein n=1 Tax=miscellaneous Crenarchaeota group-15 archaeon DG-45 TaxID=1685127 RepID=A0A0M0BK79_9ARCH|nr:MAG: hypothetical protein AC482_07410 [miscellaneous Crenarchaeota group-15 archaeon DG-45]